MKINHQLFKPFMLALMVALPLTAQAEYKIQNNGTEVLDTETGLTWQRCQVGQKWDGNTCAGEAKKLTLDDAREQTGNGWRMPTIRELSSLIYCSSGNKMDSINVGDGGSPIKVRCDPDSTSPTINTHAFPNTPASSVWSFSPAAYMQTPGMISLWFVYFGNGGSNEHFSGSTHSMRLVRGKQ
ncbi:MAG: hypothetical protein RIR79_1854 [Pseudomonadota bacterium]|jgi:hypothetical protein